MNVSDAMPRVGIRRAGLSAVDSRLKLHANPGRTGPVVTPTVFHVVTAGIDAIRRHLATLSSVPLSSTT
ncbi:MAG: hypothetical protein ACRCYR_11810 [Phycicoccus sp.]